ncbi:hypothetical protein GHK86_08130 [Acidimicrobiaceae bacterium USS-CC1]|uniref:Uncharacterized protein n=1 Tax=Acidiferrimicrobium australe TaxID=2664430 RepID=A0ABW9QSJ8_9ACTN|nr:hypothetical protein [Acidiferrimicrobium australe]
MHLMGMRYGVVIVAGAGVALVLVLGGLAAAWRRRRLRGRRQAPPPFEPRPGFRILYDADEIEHSAAKAANRDYELAMTLLLRGSSHMPSMASAPDGGVGGSVSRIRTAPATSEMVRRIGRLPAAHGGAAGTSLNG